MFDVAVLAGELDKYNNKSAPSSLSLINFEVGVVKSFVLFITDALGVDKIPATFEGAEARLLP